MEKRKILRKPIRERAIIEKKLWIFKALPHVEIGEIVFFETG
jgi:hypothetical protein